MTADEALALLIEGNLRFSKGLRSVNTFMGNLQLKALAEKGQSPAAIVVACSDSRVPTETVFDRGLGDLYVLRVAGNVISPVLMAGIEYAFTYFSVPLCLVLGHSRCGAIQASTDRLLNPDKQLPSSNLEILVQSILTSRKSRTKPTVKNQTQVVSDLLWTNVRENVKRISKESEMLNRAIQNGRFKIVGSVYDLDTGIVEFVLPAKELKKLKSA